MLEQAKKAAEENYESWGQWVVETMNDNELTAELAEHKTLSSWIKLRKRIADAIGEIESTRF